MEGFKFTDRDVRQDNTLIGAAIDYAQSYSGDFELIIAVKELIEKTGTLPVSVARAVLNTALADPRAHLLERVPVRRAVTDDKVVIQFPTRFDPFEGDGPAQPQVKYPYLLKVTWNKKFFWSLEKLAKRYHIIDPRRSNIKYYPSNKGFQVDVRSVCCSFSKWFLIPGPLEKKAYGSGGVRNTELTVKLKMGNEDETPSYLTECPRCRAGLEEFEARRDFQASRS